MAYKKTNETVEFDESFLKDLETVLPPEKRAMVIESIKKTIEDFDPDKPKNNNISIEDALALGIIEEIDD